MNISVRDLSYSYPNGVAALRGVSLDVATGEGVAIVGQNGSGKTTLAKQLNGLTKPDRGVVQVGDWITRDHTTAQLAARVGFLFQNPDMQIFKSRVDEEVAFGPRNLRVTGDDLETRVRAALEQTGLADLAGQHPYELHEAQRKWVAIASVLAMQTPILVLDEPTTGQDAWGLERLGRLVGNLRKSGKTILVVTHDLDFCAENLERVIVMKEGRVLADGPSAEILPQAKLLAETNLEPPQITRLALALGMREMPTTVADFLPALERRRLKSGR